MARRRKSSPSKRRQRQLMASHKGSQGQKLYNVTPKDISAAEVKWLVNKVNARLRSLEKAGLTQESAEYRLIKQYATGDPLGKGKIYNVNMDRNSIRLSASMKKFGTGEQKAYLVNVARNILSAQTSTISGTKAALWLSYERAKEKAGKAAESMTYDQYVQVWRTYRENVAPDQKGRRIGSDIVMDMIKKYNIYELSKMDLDRAFSYWNSFQKPIDWAEYVTQEMLPFK